MMRISFSSRWTTASDPGARACRLVVRAGWRRTALAQAAIAAALAGSISGCSREAERPDVLLVLLDALRADHLGCYGYERPTSPRIDAFAASGLMFRHAYSQAPWTKPSIPTLFTSLHPIQHGVYEGEARGSAGALESDVLSEEAFTIAEAFGAAGYRTAAYVNNAHLQASQGFAQGFGIYEQGSLDAKEINRRFLEFADADRRRPFFAYLHYLDAHWPFRPEPPFDRLFPTPKGTLEFTKEEWRGLRDRINDGIQSLGPEDRARLIALHDGAIAELDSRIGELLDALEARGALRRTVILLTSDHGEELFDHGKVGHGGTLFEEVLKIPMILAVPAGRRGEASDVVARTLDVFPTLLDAAGIPIPRGLEGRSLVGARDTASVEVVAETLHGRTYKVAGRSGSWKHIRTYRAPRRGREESRALQAPRLEPGLRVKVRGTFSPDGTLAASRISVRDSSDDDAEVTGPVVALDRGSGRFRLHGFTIVPTRKLLDRGSGLAVGDLENGLWVKAEGRLDREGAALVLEADALEDVPDADRETEIEGIIDGVESPSREAIRLSVLKTPVIVDSKTKVRDIEASKDAPPASAEGPIPTPIASDDPFCLARLRDGTGLDIEDALFDLERDPLELENLASREPQRLARAQEDLARWLNRMEISRVRMRGSRQALPPSDVERLRALGYVR